MGRDGSNGRKRRDDARVEFFNHPPFIQSARFTPVYLRFVYIINGTSPRFPAPRPI